MSPVKIKILFVGQNSKTYTPSVTLRRKKVNDGEKFKYLGTHFTARSLAKKVANKQKAAKRKSKKTPRQAPKTTFLNINAHLDN